MPAEAQARIAHLFQVPQHRRAAAALIHQEFWTTVPGASVDGMAARLATACDADHVPLALVALHSDQVVGAINLVDSDDDAHPEWTPWLAGAVVHADWRGRGVGTALVRSLVANAWRLDVERVYFGTSAPGFYERLGAVRHQQVRSDFCFMRFDRGAVSSDS